MKEMDHGYEKQDNDDDRDETFKVAPRLFSLARRIATGLRHRKTRNGSDHDVTTLGWGKLFILWQDWPITDLRADTHFPKRSPIYIFMW